MIGLKIVKYECRWIVDQETRQIVSSSHKTEQGARERAKIESAEDRYEFAEAAALAYNKKAIKTWKYVWGRWLVENERIIAEFKVKAWTKERKVIERLVLSFDKHVKVNDILEYVYGKGDGRGLRAILKKVQQNIIDNNLAYKLTRHKDKKSKQVSYCLTTEALPQKGYG